MELEGGHVVLSPAAPGELAGRLKQEGGGVHG